MNGWRYRLTFGAVLWVMLEVHAGAMAAMPNTPAGMLVFHGSAALLDLFLLYGAAWLCAGRLLDHMENLCFISIVLNALGWALYLAYAPPDYYNTCMWALSFTQWGRLLYVDRADGTFSPDPFGRDLVHRAHYVGS